MDGFYDRIRIFIIRVASRIGPDFDVPSRLRTEIVSINRGNDRILTGIGYRHPGVRRGPQIHSFGKEADGIRRVKGNGL